MPNTNSNQPVNNASMFWPVTWGILATLGFYSVIHFNVFESALITRYFASHPVEYITTLMFCVGIAALVRKFMEVAAQPKADGAWLGPVPVEGQAVEDCPHLLQTLAELPAGEQNSFVGRRLRAALQYVHRTNSAAGLEDQLRNLAETDEARSHASYSLVRIVTSTIPILGFLGTVIGITRAVAELAQIVGDVSFEQAINSVVSGLSVAFDTTALALGLSIVLMFGMFFVSRWEARCLTDADTAVEDALVGRFRVDEASEDTNVAMIRRMAKAVMESSEQLVERQAALWQQSLDAASDRWSNMTVTTEHQLETALTRALQTSIEAHTRKLNEAEEAADARVGRYWQDMLGTMDKQIEVIRSQYTELQRQGEIMTKAVDATGRIMQLENALNQNLSALRESNQFDEAVNSLAAAISVLNAKIGSATQPASNVRLGAPKQTGHAA